MKKILIVFISVLLFFLFSCDNNSTSSESKTSANNVVIPYGFIGAVGEGYGKTDVESEEIAKKDALRKIAEQIYVEIKSDSTLKENLTQIIENKQVKEKAETKLENIVNTTTDIEIVGVDFTLIDKRLINGQYYTKVLGLLDKETALFAYRTYFAIKIGQSLLEGKMIYSAQKVALEYEKLISENKDKLPANMVSELISTVSKIKKSWNDIIALYNDLENKEIKTVENALKLLEAIDKLNSQCIDFPQDKIEPLKEKAKTFVKDIKITLNGPKSVSVGQRIDIFVELSPKIKGNYTFSVKSKNAEFPEFITIKDGKGTLSGIVKDKDILVEVSLGNLIFERYSPGTSEGAGVSSQKVGEIIRISSQGVANQRNAAIEGALTLAVKKAIGIVFSQDVNLLLSIPVDKDLVNALFGVLKYEIVKEKYENETYNIVINVSFNRDEFKDLVTKIISQKPVGYAVIVVNNDQYGYIEPIFENKLLESGINLVSKEYSRKLAQYSDPNILSKLAILSAAKYVINIKVNYGEAYSSEYKIWSMRLFLNVQIINTLTGQIVKSENFEDVAAGATKEAALSKILNSEKFSDFLNNLIEELKKPYSFAEKSNVVRKINLKFYFEKSTYLLIMKDYLSEKFGKVELIEKEENYGILSLSTHLTNEEIISIVTSFINLNIKVLKVSPTQIEFKIN
ncbi:lipoprotein [Thermosipho africanus H17ap60334]|jgi:hypothetical protein|uniref:LPP20 family lipoprotein n=1 Tax=Thermosipho africanus TaxID=2421 RepID=UPI00028CBCDA|nr:LPP20 family lipoprotein [Thermosipho africanus]EKF50285.1 lipoprotein [Thermosipho africanus H17ap60334]